MNTTTESGDGLHRVAEITIPVGVDEDISKKRSVFLEHEPSPSFGDMVSACFSERSSRDILRAREAPFVPPLEKHLEVVLRPALSELNERYIFQNRDGLIDVDEIIDRVLDESRWDAAWNEQARLSERVEAIPHPMETGQVLGREEDGRSEVLG